MGLVADEPEESATGYAPGTFACPSTFRKVMPLYARLQPAGVLRSLREYLGRSQRMCADHVAESPRSDAAAFCRCRHRAPRPHAATDGPVCGTSFLLLF